MGVLLDGIDPQKEWGLIFLRDHYHPATPEMRNRTMTIPGMPGEWDFGSEWGSRPFTLPFGLIDYDRYELQRKLRAFVAFLMDAYGKPREIKLSFDYEPDKFYTVKVNGKVDVERAIHTGQFELPLMAHKPLAKSNLSAEEVTMSSDVSVLADISVGANYTFDISQSQTITVINDGTVAVRPTIIVDGSVPEGFTVSANGKSFSFANFENKVYEFNGEKYTVKQSTGFNALYAMTGDFIELLPGNNAVTVTGNNMDINMTFKFHNLYV